MGKSLEKLFKEVMAVIDKLPQRSVISDEVAERWANGIIRFEPDRAVWHAKRAGGIGGSEAGEFVLAALGERPAYKDLESLWRQKMLLDLPEYSNQYMRLGTYLEDLAEAVYLKLSGHESVMGTKEVQDIFSKPHPDYPFLIGNPDICVNANGLRVITDFKVRNNLDENKGVSLINGAQVHWYGMLYSANGSKPVDGYGLAELDLPSEMMADLMKNPPDDWEALASEIAAINRPGFGMKIRYFPHNENLANNLVRLTEKFWLDHVMTGQPYRKPEPKLPENMTEEDQAIVNKAQQDFLQYKLAEKVAKENADKARSTAVQVASKYEMKEWPFNTNGLSAGITKKFNKQEAASVLLSKGVPESSIRKGKGPANSDRMMQTLENHGLLSDAHFESDWDTRAVKAALKGKGLNTEDFDRSTVRLSLSKKQDDAPVLELLESKMLSHISNFAQVTAPHNGAQDPGASLDDESSDMDDNLKLA